MKKILCAMALAAAIVGLGCSRNEQPSLLQHDAVMVSQGIQDVWSKFDTGTMLFINAKNMYQVPAPLRGLIISPTTTFDYVYVRVWDERKHRQLYRQYVAHYVLRDLKTGELLRGDIQNGITTFHPLPVNYWESLT